MEKFLIVILKSASHFIKYHAVHTMVNNYNRVTSPSRWRYIYAFFAAFAAGFASSKASAKTCRTFSTNIKFKSSKTS
ncbi:hypothetical protein BH18ACI3_BH18ACI3_16960 [soil metagenome]